MPVTDIKYVEVTGHKLLWHTTHGEYVMCGNLGKLEEVLPKKDFVRINSCYIVNMKYVTFVKTQTVSIGAEELKISQSRKKDFLRAMAEYIGDGGVLINVRTQRLFLVKGAFHRRAAYCGNAYRSPPSQAQKIRVKGGVKRDRVYRACARNARAEHFGVIHFFFIPCHIRVHHRRDKALFQRKPENGDILRYSGVYGATHRIRVV